MTPTIAQDSPTWFKIASNMPPRGLKIVPRQLHVATGPPKDAPERPKSFQHFTNNDFCILDVSLLMGF